MPDPSQPAPNPFDRPSARAAGSMPVQRGNYGIPPRRPAPTGPRMMDVLPPQQQQPAPRPLAPAPTPTPQTPVIAPGIPSPSPAPVPVVTVSQPLYTNTPNPVELPEPPRERGRLLPKLRLVVLIVATLLTLGGIVRWATAGSTSGDSIAAGAVALNDGKTMTIQFTADDGQIHKFTNKSNSKLIPGSPVQVAYRSGAPENSAKQLAPIQAAHSVGVSLLVAGVLLFATAGILTLVMRRRPKQAHQASIAKPVTV